MRVFFGTYLRSNGVNKFTFLVSGILYPIMIATVLLITYKLSLFKMEALIFSFIGCDLTVVLLLFGMTFYFISKIKEKQTNLILSPKDF